MAGLNVSNPLYTAPKPSSGWGFNPINVVKTQASNLYNKVSDPNYDLIPFIGLPDNGTATKSSIGPAGSYKVASKDPTVLGAEGGGDVLGAQYYDPYTGGYSSTPPVDTSAQERAAALFGIDQSLSGANDALGRLDGQLNTGYGNIDRDYQREYDILTGDRSRNLDRYKQQEVGQLNEYISNKSNNNMNAANWLMGARNTLGSQGAGGGSAARYALPYEAQTQASAANSGAQAVNNRNMQAIAGSRQQDEDQFTNAQNDLGYQKDVGRRDLQSRIESQRATLLNQIGGLQGQRAIANGGDFRAAQAAASPYTSRIAEILNSIDGLAATPGIKARQVTLGKPDLSGYNWARPGAAPVAQQDPTQGPNVIRTADDDRRNPILSLFGLDDQRQFA